MPKSYHRNEGIATLTPPRGYKQSREESNTHSTVKERLASICRKAADYLSSQPVPQTETEPPKKRITWQQYRTNLLERLIPYLPLQEEIKDPRSGENWSNEARDQYYKQINERARRIKQEVEKLRKKALDYLATLPESERLPLCEAYAESDAHDLAVLSAVYGRHEAVRIFEEWYLKSR